MSKVSQHYYKLVLWRKNLSIDLMGFYFTMYAHRIPESYKSSLTNTQTFKLTFDQKTSKYSLKDKLCKIHRCTQAIAHKQFQKHTRTENHRISSTHTHTINSVLFMYPQSFTSTAASSNPMWRETQKNAQNKQTNTHTQMYIHAHPI